MGSEHHLPPNTVGFTTSLPVEVLLAAGFRPLDLNNAFVGGPGPERDIAEAESAGIPRNICAWIKGIYGTVKRLAIRKVVGVLSGDCSYTEGLLDILADDGVEIIGFHFPPEPSSEKMGQAIAALAAAFGVELSAVEETWQRLKPLRSALAELDRLTWQEGNISGEENFQYLINSSDFRGEPDAFSAEVAALLDEACRRTSAPSRLRIGIAGIPPAFSNLHRFLEASGVQVVYNEMPREFAMLEPAADILEQYSLYTYPYPFRWRSARILREVKKRALDGVIHYVQAFCYRGMHDRLLRRRLAPPDAERTVPVLTLEGDRPGPVGAREAVRLEGFIEMLEAKRKRGCE